MILLYTVHVILDPEVTLNSPTVGGLLKRLAYSGSTLSASSVLTHVTTAGLHMVVRQRERERERD